MALSAWCTLDLSAGKVGICEVDVESKREWVFGYGFSFAYAWEAWREHWFRDMNLGEDHEFVESLLARGARVVLTKGIGACAHVHHGSNFSEWELARPLKKVTDRVKPLLKVAEVMLRMLDPEVPVQDCKQFTMKTAMALQDDMIRGVSSEKLQQALNEAWRATASDP
eukprot:gnl/TRDRNA2_/TRDRNA2_149342_c0_seq1.p1 gnl/TRDRNA2_/TRDRNA2_149342_c0~~gnl/TRDRNA2_/TRDRNA2_149342_c0_seq1.p1  ORF type:complete len:168 (+),score=29.21 gnl/TRDRNA2_/TRDRNA2_149342_c0_seq1:145-648(+)